MTRAVTALALALLGVAAPPAAWGARRSLDHALPRAAAARRLQAVRSEVRALRREHHRPVVVFDIDDTLIKSGPWGPGPGPDPRSRVEPGALRYVRSLLRDGARVVYLSGRQTKERRDTRALLEQAGFPLGPDARLLLNPSAGWQPALAWKRRARSRILSLGQPVAFFDNEKANVRLFRAQYPDAAVFRLRTISHPDPGGAGPIEVIAGFPL